VVISFDDLAPIMALNEEVIGLVEKALSDYPCHIPLSQHMAVRTAIKVARDATAMPPEVAFFLGWTISNLMANKARYTVSNAFQNAAQGAMYG
jgi:hypothetical protein